MLGICQLTDVWMVFTLVCKYVCMYVVYSDRCDGVKQVGNTGCKISYLSC